MLGSSVKFVLVSPAAPGPPVAGCVALERTSTDGRVGVSGCEAEERIIPLSRVAIGIASVRCWRKRRADEDHRDEDKTEPQMRPVD